MYVTYSQLAARLPAPQQNEQWLGQLNQSQATLASWQACQANRKLVSFGGKPGRLPRLLAILRKAK